MNLRPALVPLLVSAGAGSAVYLAAGPTLGLFLGGFLMTGLITPALIAREKSSTWDAGWALAGICLGQAGVWMIAARLPTISIFNVLEAAALLAAFIFAVAGVTRIFQSFIRPPLLAAAAAALLALAWLTWPIWLTEAIQADSGQAIVSRLAPVDPLIAVNGIVRQFGTWDHYSIAYARLTVLNQDVAYALPPAPWPAAILHAGIGVAAILISSLRTPAGIPRTS